LVLGLCKGEVLGLTWELVDLDAAELYVGEQLQRVGGQLLRREVKTETSEAPLPLPGLCVTALKIRKQQQEADRARAGQVPTITVHGTRKTCGSLLAALDVHPRFAMQILRHSKIAVTMELYTEVPSVATREALEKLGQWLDPDS